MLKNIQENIQARDKKPSFKNNEERLNIFISDYSVNYEGKTGSFIINQSVLFVFWAGAF